MPRPKAKSNAVAPAAPAGYSGTPLPKKLGIKPGSVVALLGAPSGFVKKTLGPVPDGAVLREDVRVPFNVGLLFVDSKAELAKRFPAVQKAMGEPCALWLCWPKKASGVPTDLDENKIRDFVLMAGLVDYKVAAVDATWSGLCFARRRKWMGSGLDRALLNARFKMTLVLTLPRIAVAIGLDHGLLAFHSRLGAIVRAQSVPRPITFRS